MHLLNNGYYLNFGAARGIGSMSYAVLAFFLGSLTLIFGLRCLPVIGSLLYLLMAVLLQAFPETKRSGSSIVSSRGTVSILRENHRFAVLCLGIILIFISHSAINTYMIQILQKIGKGNQELGQVMAYTAVLEFFVMVGFSRFVKGRDCGNILRFTAIFFCAESHFCSLGTYSAFDLRGLSDTDFFLCPVHTGFCLLCKCHSSCRGQSKRTGNDHHCHHHRQHRRQLSLRPFHHPLGHHSGYPGDRWHCRHWSDLLLPWRGKNRTHYLF